MTPTQVRAFIKANHTTHTAGELAAATGVSPSTITVYSKELGVQAIGIKEKRIQFIKAHPELSVIRLAEALGCDKGTVANMISQNKMRPKATVDPAKWNALKAQATGNTTEASGAELAGLLGYVKEVAPRVRPKAVYSQTHSPFGFADELRGMETTGDPQVKYPETYKL